METKPLLGSPDLQTSRVVKVERRHRSPANDGQSLNPIVQESEMVRPRFSRRMKQGYE